MIYLLFILFFLVGCSHTETGPAGDAVTDESVFQPGPHARPLARLGVSDPVALLSGDEKTKNAHYRLLIETAKKEKIAETPEAQAEWNRTLYELYLSRKMKEAGVPSELTDAQLREAYIDAPLLRVRDLVLLASSPAEKEKARKKAEEIRAQYQKGQPFPKLVQKYSEDPGSKGRGGDLDFRGEHNLPGALYLAAKQTPVDSLSAPVDLGDSIHILQVAGRRSFEEAGAPYLEYLRGRRKEKELHEFTDRLIAQIERARAAPTYAPRPYLKLGNPRVENQVSPGPKVADKEEGK